MTIPTPTMQLEKPQAGDLMEPYFLGTMPTGGYWTILERLSEHDHTGGLLGKTLGAATIPDGSITTSKLDPSVLAPYALTDGSKPFSGQVEMQADAVVRDRLWFGEQGTALAPDTWLERAGAGALRTDRFLGVGGAPRPDWYGTFAGVQVGASGSLVGDAGDYTALGHNTFTDGAGVPRALRAAAAVQVRLEGGALSVRTAPTAVAAGDAQAFATRLALGPTGTTTLTPNDGQAALVVGGNPGTIGTPPGQSLVLHSEGSITLWPNSALVAPVNETVNMGGPSPNRFAAFFGVAGTINTSAAEAKSDITPLDPAAALAAALATDPVVFAYKPPVRDAAWYELPDDLEEAERVLYQRMTNAPLLEAARHQAGFVLSSNDYHTDALFETGKGQSSATNSIGILLGSIHELHRRITALGG